MKNPDAKADPNLIYALKTPSEIFIAKCLRSYTEEDAYVWVSVSTLRIRIPNSSKVESLEKLITHPNGELWVFKTVNEFYKWASDITQE